MRKQAAGLLLLATVCVAEPSVGGGPHACCMAMIPSCLACAQGISEEEYCRRNPMEPLCSNGGDFGNGGFGHQCPSIKVFQQCGTACPPKCKEPNGPSACIMMCVAGCFCPDGYVELGNDCVRPKQCPGRGAGGSRSCAAVSCLAPDCGAWGSYTPPGECCPVCGSQGPRAPIPVVDFASCVQAGNPVMESWPEQCYDPLSGQMFVNNGLTGGPPTQPHEDVCQPNTAVRGQNDRIMEQRLSREQCLQACRRMSSFMCRSVEHHPRTNQCVLSSAGRGMPTIQSSQGWSLCYVRADDLGQDTWPDTWSMGQYMPGTRLPFRGQPYFGGRRYTRGGGLDRSGRFGLYGRGRGAGPGPSFVPVVDFASCVEAGNPVMESWPERCHDPVSGQTFVNDDRIAVPRIPGQNFNGGSKWCEYQGQHVPPGPISIDPLCTCDGNVGLPICS